MTLQDEDWANLNITNLADRHVFLNYCLSLNFRIYIFPGIFAYLNYLEPQSRARILEILLNGLKRLEYRGYDSAGMLFFIGFVPLKSETEKCTYLFLRK